MQVHSVGWRPRGFSSGWPTWTVSLELTMHLGVVDLLEEEGYLENEQAALDDHDDRVTHLFDRAHLTTSDEREKKAEARSTALSEPRPQHLEGNLRNVSEAEVHRCLFEQYDEQLSGLKLELYDISRSILSMEGDVSELSDHEARVYKTIMHRRLFRDTSTAPQTCFCCSLMVLSSPRSTCRRSMGTLWVVRFADLWQSLSASTLHGDPEDRNVTPWQK